MSKKQCILPIISVILILISLANSGCNLIDDYPIYTNNPEDYGSDQYLLDLTFFMPKLPNNAKIITFSYYNYWNEAKDIYLELKFSSKVEMEKYLEDLNNYNLDNLDQYHRPEGYDWFLSETSIYDAMYTDSFCLFFNTTRAGEKFTGYSVHPTGVSGVTKDETYKCNFGLISYSYDELIVIQTCTQGIFRKAVHNYIPVYFQRFNVPLNEEHSRLFNIVRTGDGSRPLKK